MTELWGESHSSSNLVIYTVLSTSRSSWATSGKWGIGMPNLGWGISGDLRMEPGKDGDLSGLQCHKIYPHKNQLFPRRTDLHSLDKTCNSRGSHKHIKLPYIDSDLWSIKAVLAYNKNKKNAYSIC